MRLNAIWHGLGQLLIHRLPQKRNRPGFERWYSIGRTRMKSEERASTELLRQETVEVYREFSGALAAYSRRLTSDMELAQDAIQETFLRFFLVRMQGETIRNPSAWLHRVAHNYIVETVRSSAVQACVALDEEALGKAQVEPETGSIELEDTFKAMLAPREFECLKLRTEGLDYSEIADAMSIRPGTVGALLHRVGQKMRFGLRRRGIR